MTFRDQYRADMEKVVPSGEFEEKMRALLRREASDSPNAAPVAVTRDGSTVSPLRVDALGENRPVEKKKDSFRRWKTAAIVLAAACFVLLLGTGALSTLLLKGGMNAVQNDTTAEGELLTGGANLYDRDGDPSEEAAAEEPVSDGFTLYPGAEGPDGIDSDQEDETAESNMVGFSNSENGGGGGVWLNGLYASNAGDLLSLYAAPEELTALACPGESGVSEPLPLDEQTVSDFAGLLYNAGVGDLCEGMVYEDDSGEGWDWSEVSDTEHLSLLLCLSDGSALRLTVYAGGCVRLGELNAVFSMDPTAEAFLTVWNRLSSH